MCGLQGHAAVTANAVNARDHGEQVNAKPRSDVCEAHSVHGIRNVGSAHSVRCGNHIRMMLVYVFVFTGADSQCLRIDFGW